MQRVVLHLTFPVHDLPEAKEFYRRVLGAEIAYLGTYRADVLLFERHLTLRERSRDAPPSNHRHAHRLGTLLPWTSWLRWADRLSLAPVGFAQAPAVRRHGVAYEEASLALADPSGNLIELKSYRSKETAPNQPAPKSAIFNRHGLR